MVFNHRKALVLLILALVVALPLMFVYTGVSYIEAFVGFFLVLAVSDFRGVTSTIVKCTKIYSSPTKTIGGSSGGGNHWVFSSPLIDTGVGLYCASSISKIMFGSDFVGFYG